MAERISFHPDLSSLMSVHCGNKDTFLRPLLALSAKSLDRGRLADLSKVENLFIKIIPDKVAKTLTLLDNGAGMTESDLVALCTVAKGVDPCDLGVYAAYQVAHKVAIHSKHKADSQYLWEGPVGDTFTLGRDPGEALDRGTKIVLHLKEEEVDYLNEAKIKAIVVTHAQFIAYPVILQTAKTLSEDKAGGEKTTDQIEEEKIKARFQDEVIVDFNWSKNFDDISEESLYKYLTNDGDKFLHSGTFREVSPIKFKAMLFVSECPKEGGVRVFVDGIQIEAKNLLPEYLRFISGVFILEDLYLGTFLPYVFTGIGSDLVEKCILLLGTGTGNELLNQFAAQVKRGVCSDSANRLKLASLLRYETSKSNGQTKSLDDYVDKMTEGQKYIYYITGESVEAVSKSVLLEGLRKRNIEVMYMTEPADKIILDHLTVFKGFSFVSVATKLLDLPENEEEKKDYEASEKSFKKLCQIIKEILHKKVAEVGISKRLVHTPSCVFVYNSRLYFEINPNHEKIKALRNALEQNGNIDVALNVESLFQAALKSVQTSDPLMKTWFEYLSEDIDDSARVFVRVLIDQMGSKPDRRVSFKVQGETLVSMMARIRLEFGKADQDVAFPKASKLVLYVTDSPTDIADPPDRFIKSASEEKGGYILVASIPETATRESTACFDFVLDRLKVVSKVKVIVGHRLINKIKAIFKFSP